MQKLTGFELGTPVAAAGSAPQDRAADPLAPVLAQILDGLRDIRDRLAGTRKDWYTIEEVARLTGRTSYSVRRWVKDGRITAIRVNGTGPRGQLLVAQDQIQRLVAAGLGGESPAHAGR